jgi:hypothetical protein
LTGIWKLRGVRKRPEKGRCPVCDKDEYVVGTRIIKMFGNEAVKGKSFE